jgi:predicted transcriptional regulator
MARFNIEFSDEAAAALEELAAKQNTSKAEVIRKALSLEKWFNETTAGGAKILVESDGRVREILKL